MVDFRKRLGIKQIEKKINPVEIYDSLDRRSVTGPLRPAQEDVLTTWYKNRRNDRDLIVKLHTGEGKTLIGLLILQSKINSGDGPCIFICPNIYLVEQACLEAEKFGVPFCVIEPDNSIPNDFSDGNKILITHIQKVFNGLSIFGLDHSYVPAENVILDDSHACIDAIKNSFTIRIKSDSSAYEQIKSLFETDLINQGHGSFMEIENEEYNTFLPIPYWSWIDKKDQVIDVISSNKELSEIKFVWPIIKNSIEYCQAYISGKGIEISPYHMPVSKFGTFSKASQRILMSATTQDDSFFVKGLGFKPDSVRTPLSCETQKWSGEKMILIPSLIHDNLDRELMVTNLAKPKNKRYGTVVLVSSFTKSEYYKSLGSTVSKSDSIFTNVMNLKERRSFEKTLVLVNRYDGIDLPDDACRVLIIDSKPFFHSLSDRYEESCRQNSETISIKLAQRIEQGLGRSVRGEKDYSVILIIGGDLVKFIKSSRTNKFFSPQTRKQIELGLEIAKLASEELKEGDSDFKIIESLIRQSLDRDEGWKEYYKENMDKIDPKSDSNDLYEILSLEREAEEQNFIGNAETASEILQSLIDTYISDNEETGWCLQTLARYKYEISKTESNQLQKDAFLKNLQLLNPREGISYQKLDFINEDRIRRIKTSLSRHTDYSELMLFTDGMLDNLNFGVQSEKFENAIKELGELLGFKSQRPDKEYKKGPDNLWCGVDSHYFILECKSEVKDTRDEINKHEASQMNSHCGWFDDVYNTQKVERILIIPTRKLSKHANLTHTIKIMKKSKLKSLKSNVHSFLKEFKNYNLHEISDQKFQELINTHKLDLESLKNDYTEMVYFQN
tara:strand:+ start:38238 stop:40763 length:2526 start_codon:yes stop_codon:yes gene_type:complete